MRLLALSILALSLGACAHVHSFNQDAILGGEAEFIETVGEKTVWFNFNFDSDFIDEARTKFMSTCPSGQISGVSSRLSSENSFFHWKSRVRFTGYCSKTEAAAATAAAPAEEKVIPVETATVSESNRPPVEVIIE